MTTKFHHQKLPSYSTLLAGREPPNEIGFRSDRLQIWYNNTNTPWQDDGLHAHLESDECFIVLKGTLIVMLEDNKRIRIAAEEFCCFPIGIYHAVVDVETPAETLMIRAPSVSDKVLQGKTQPKGHIHHKGIEVNKQELRARAKNDWLSALALCSSSLL